jgi:glutaredoxin
MKLTLYIKTNCPWCVGAVNFLREEGIPFEEKNVSENETFFEEMQSLSNQTKAPTMNLDGEIFPDVGEEEIADILEQKGYYSR